MTKISFSKKIHKEFNKKEDRKTVRLSFWKLLFKTKGEKKQERTFFHYIFALILFVFGYIAILVTLFSLQIISHEKYVNGSNANQFEVEEIKPDRGIIVDRNGIAVAKNIPAVSVYIDKGEFLDNDKLKEDCEKLERVIGDTWKRSIDSKYNSLYEKVLDIWNNMSSNDQAWVKRVEILSGLSNDIAIAIKAKGNELSFVTTKNGNTRYYPYGESMSLILGYTGDVFAEDLKELEYISFNDTIGKTGLEKVYDAQLFGTKGNVAVQRNVDNPIEKKTEAISGKTLVLSIDSKVQKKVYDTLKTGVKKYGAKGGAAIIENVRTGEIVAMANYPTFDSNKFVTGITQKEYDALIKKYSNPMLNRAISAEVPPGSTFKTIVAAAALDAKAITKNTTYVSRRGYTFSNGKVFQEFHNNAYGTLNVVGALTVSSNIFFCETIRDWDMDKLVPYLDNFGIGKRTGVDLLGEGSGRLPSPENKIALAKTTSPWLEPVWYPEGDSCNSVIGQGITTVTPIQMVNWVAAIANGGTLNTPHLAVKYEDYNGNTENINWSPINNKVAKESALSIVREGMWSAVNGARRVIIPLSKISVSVAAKTGTAEFGKVNSQGVYENTHAWVTGFFPYENPKYSFVVFLEDGGESNNASLIAAEFIEWFVTH